jgi:mono/diheme cytochrome c family protein
MKTCCFGIAMLLGTIALAQSRGSAENGKRLYLRDGCWECHGYAGQGGRDGAQIANTSFTTAQLTRYVRRPTGAMPAYSDKVVSDEELANIWSYLKSMPRPRTAKDIPLLNDLKESGGGPAQMSGSPDAGR